MQRFPAQLHLVAAAYDQIVFIDLFLKEVIAMSTVDISVHF